MEHDDIDNMICDLTDVANTLKHHRVSDEMLKQYPHFQEFRLKGGTLLDLPKGDGGIFTIGEPFTRTNPSTSFAILRQISAHRSKPPQEHQTIQCHQCFPPMVESCHMWLQP